jgi:hypothetical protein
LQAVREVITKEVSARIDDLEKQTDARFVALEKSIDVRFAALEKSIDVRFVALEKSLDERFSDIKMDIANVRGNLDGEARWSHMMSSVNRKSA